ncbi:MAG: deoxyribose-phosphate aldolase [Lachnospiraceae bacterium]|nr:deoxyribose-phosphate aldolase [Lachnospiraceae bacterium]
MSFDPKLFDHTILKADASCADVKKVCAEAVKYGFASVCVNTYYAKLVKKELEGSGVELCCVVGFPLGQADSESKAFEASRAVQAGADEVDMVINVAALKDGDYDAVSKDIAAVREATKGRVLKVIIETCLLTDEEKEKACELSVKAGADFVKTSTGFSTGGAKAEDVALMRRVVGPSIGVKASGGIRDAATARKMLDAGASRLGTSATVAIVEGA